MALQFTTSEKAQCYCLTENKENIEHINQLHVQLSSLPSPDTPITIDSFPIDIRSETSVFRPRNIANLWTQLLSIHIQSGHFWSHKDALALHKERCPPKLSRDALAELEHEKLTKGVLYLRHKIQRGLLSRDRQPIEAELPEISGFISKLESFGDLDDRILRHSKIHKVCKAILKLEEIPGDDTYQFKSRCAALLERYTKVLDSAPLEHASFQSVISPSHGRNAATTASSQNDVDDGGPTEAPAMCLTQLTQEQCAKIEEEAAKFDPPLDRGVVELMCMLPHFTSKYPDDLQIIPMGKMQQTFDSYPTLDRGIYSGGPIIPHHISKLTFWVAPGFRAAFYIDTKTGESVELDRFDPDGAVYRDDEFEGPRRPIEELLQEWIDLSLNLKILPSKDIYFLSDRSRSMDYLNKKYLLQEFGWPSSFPLSTSNYLSLIRRQSDLDKERSKRWDDRLDNRWVQLSDYWHGLNSDPEEEDPIKIKEIETLRVLDDEIKKALTYHINKREDRRFALAEDLPLDSRYQGALYLIPSTRSFLDWQIDVTPSMIIERLKDVLGPKEATTETLKMEEILVAAYNRNLLRRDNIYPSEEMSEDDDDETSDYTPSEEECSEEEEFESDEEDEGLEFDIVMLEEDSKTDIEDLRKRIEGFEMDLS